MKDTKQPLEPAGESCGRPQVEIKDEGDDLTLLGTVQNDGEARLASASTGNELRWSESSSVETGFSILRCSSEYGDYDVVGWVGPKTTSYLDATAPTNEVNWYKVREEGPGGPLYSDGVSIARPPVSVTALMSALSESPGDFGAFRFTRDDWYPNYETAVRFTLGGEAAAGVDYELIGPDGQVIEDGVVTIPAKRDSVDVIVRAIADNVSELDERIVLTLTAGAADGYRLGFWAEATLTIHETPDLIDIDSDNTNGFDDPDRTPEEDRIEDDATKPGKILAVNDNDDDGDGIPDFADGFDWDGITSEDDRAAFDDPNTPEHEPQEQFVPVILVLPEGVNPSVAKVKLTYSASDPRPYHVTENPDGLQRTGSGTAQDPYIYAAGPGDLRLWTKDGSAARDKASLATGGDFVPSNVELSWSALPDGPTADTQRLWLEAIAPSTNLGDQQITVSLDPDGPGPGGYVASDAVRVSNLRVDLDIDSDNNNGTGDPSRSAVEDSMEDCEGDDARPGKVILVDDFDSDGDGIPDYADGYDLDANDPNDDISTGSVFIPVVFDIGAAWSTGAKVRITYAASDPLAVEPSENDPYLRPAGFLRLWTVDGSTARNPRPLAFGGDYVAPGEYSAAKFGSQALYLEAVDLSEDVADLIIDVELDPTGLSGFVPGDRVRVTATRIEILGKGYGDEEYYPWDWFVRSDLSAEPANGITPGAFAAFKVRVYDPRQTGLGQLTLGSQGLSLSDVGDLYETPAFVINAPGAPDNWAVAYQHLVLSGHNINIEYNPRAKTRMYNVKKPKPHHIEVHDLIDNMVMPSLKNDASWHNPWDDGAFGTAFDAKMATTLQNLPDGARWKSYVYVEVNIATGTTGHIKHIGYVADTKLLKKEIRDGLNAGTIQQVDAVKLRPGQTMNEGDAWDLSKYEAVQDWKTGTRGRLRPEQKQRLMVLCQDDLEKLEVVLPAEYWDGQKWVKNRDRDVRTKIFKRLAVTATATIAVVPLINMYNSDWDWLVNRAVFIATKELRGGYRGVNEHQKRVDVKEWVERLCDYMESQLPAGDGDLAVVKGASAYAIMTDIIDVVNP
jgi:hypothetical protein